jgi:hypothetical protein
MQGVDQTVKLTWKDLSEAELRAALARVKGGGDAQASMRLIEFFHRRIRDGLPYDQTVLLEFLEHVFGRILEGRTADDALGLNRRPDTQ